MENYGLVLMIAGFAGLIIVLCCIIMSKDKKLKKLKLKIFTLENLHIYESGVNKQAVELCQSQHEKFKKLHAELEQLKQERSK